MPSWRRNTSRPESSPNLLGNHLDWFKRPHLERAELKVTEVGLWLQLHPPCRQGGAFSKAHLQAEPTSIVPLMTIRDVTTEGGLVFGLVVLPEIEDDAMTFSVECLHDAYEDFVISQIAVQREVEILGEAPSGAEDRLAQACSALERELIHHPRI